MDRVFFKLKTKDWIILGFLLFLFIGIRSLNFPLHLNFSFDQAHASSKALFLWHNRELTLVGPGSSLIVEGKQLLQGSINYYFLLVFLLIGSFDPIMSSYFFMLFSAVMLIPLYYGVKLLIDKRASVLIGLIYTLLPLYIDFTRFFFGPGFQLSLLPILILILGLYKKTRKEIYILLAFIWLGVISQFHFATFILLPILFSYFFLNFKAIQKHQSFTKLLLISLSGFAVGFAPIIIFELKNKFYNTVILIEYFKTSLNLNNFQLLPHRYLSLSLVFFIYLAGIFKKHLNKKIILIALALMLVFDLIIYLPRPDRAFGMSENWNYLLEKQAFDIIKKQKLTDYNITNLIYDNLATVIKYLMKKQGISLNYDDYYHNRYLFVIDKSEKNLNKNPAYEINTFSPRKKIRKWKLNDYYNLYLFERIQKIES